MHRSKQRDVAQSQAGLPLSGRVPTRENDAGSLSKETEQLDGEKWPDVLFEDGLVTGECGRL